MQFARMTGPATANLCLLEHFLFTPLRSTAFLSSLHWENVRSSVNTLIENALEAVLMKSVRSSFLARKHRHNHAPKARRIPARGNAPGSCPSRISALQGRRIPPPLQGGPINSETQGVALGWSAAALSAPRSKDVQFQIRESYGCRFVGWLRDCLSQAQWPTSLPAFSAGRPGASSLWKSVRVNLRGAFASLASPALAFPAC
jgi:hypothetical protein